MSTPKSNIKSSAAQGRKKNRAQTKQKKPSSAPRCTKSQDDFPVVALGASAGGLKAVRELLTELPADTGMAFVLIQHLSPTYDSSLPEILSKSTTMLVQTAEDGQLLQPNTLSVIPPNFSLLLENRRLRLQARKEKAGVFHPVDQFFLSLADELQAKSIAVILSGADSDGAKGVIAIRDAGGLTMAQSEESADYVGMPHQALLTDKVDFCGNPTEIGKLLGEIASHPHLNPDVLADSISSKDKASDTFGQIIQQLRKTGADFSDYKQSTVRRRILRRMAINRLRTLDDYLDKIKDSELELEALKEDLLIKVTRFFRDPEIFEILNQDIFPRLLDGRDAKHPLRVWVPGCASGEEVYSLAICLMEILETRSSDVKLQIFGTDLSDISIEKARHGFYSAAEINDLEPRLRDKYFNEKDNGYQIKKFVRGLCIFSRQDFTQDPPFSRMDLISCRNVLIYLGPDLQKRVLSLFHFALAAEGVLLLGQSESIGQLDGLFSLIDPKARIYRKKKKSDRPELDFQSGAQGRKSAPLEKNAGERRPVVKDLGVDLPQAMAAQMLRKYDPTVVVIDKEMKIQYFLGNSGLYLQPVSGKASLDLMNMVHDSLRMELRGLVHLTFNHQKPQSRRDLLVKLPVGERLVSLEVSPLDTDGEQQYYLIEFQSRSPEESGRAAAPAPSAEDQSELSRLKQDLSASYSYQQALFAEKDRALQEVKTSNEEILSSNEEFQSINEEMETAKEEMESSNEELSTVNQELQDRNLELVRSQEDLNNLINSSDMPFVIVDQNLTVARFSSDIKPYLKLRDADIGRPLADINLGFNLPDLTSRVRQVQLSGEVQEEEFLLKEVGWKLLRISPYMTSDDQTKGALLTLIDINKLKQSMDETRHAYRYALNIVEEIKYPLLVLDEQFRVLTANPAFYQKFKVMAAETEGSLLFELGDGQWDNPELKRLLTEILPQSLLMDDFLINFDFPYIGSRSMLVSARRIQTGKTRILISIEDVSAHLKQEEELRMARVRAEAANQAKSEFLATMSHEIRTPMTVIRGALEHFEDDGLDETQRRCLELAETASKSLLDLVDDVLDFSKIEADRLVLENKPFDLVDCVEDSVGILRTQARTKGLDLNLEIEANVPDILRADQTRLRQILINIIGNAIKFTEVGQIEVDVSLLPGKDPSHRPVEVLFSVKDTGCGIPADKQSLLFESFSQADSSITRRFGGSGLGLSICKGLVERMGGRIWVESEYGAGSSFHFTLPLTGDRRETPRELETEPAVKKVKSKMSCRILLAEDEPSIQEVMRVILEGEGWDVVIVSDGQAAIETLEKETFDIVLMDLQMSGLDGISATQAIRSQEADGQHLSIIGLTAHALTETREKCLQAGMDDVMTKPLNLEQLKLMIVTFCS
jgi:two-component system CheB/CheR fusion protein